MKATSPRPSCVARFARCVHALPALTAAVGLSLLFVVAPAPSAEGESGAHRTPPPPPAIAAPDLADAR